MGGLSMEWKEVKIGDLGQIITGKTPKTAIRENWGGKIPFLSPSDDMSNKTSPVTARTLTELGVAEVAKCLIPANSICVSCIGSDLGKVVKTDRELVTNQQINTIVPHSNIDSDFVYYLMCIVGKELNYISKTSTAVPIINKSTFSDWDIVIPREKEDQRRIASILSSLDRKIELNNKINADLEEMAQAIFKNWFVDFEPFKDGKFVDSELGMIPEGWKVVVFDNILKVTTTKTGKEGIPEYSVTNTGIHPRDEKFTKNLSKSSAKNKLIRKGNLVFGMSREILNWGIMKEEVGGVSSAYNVYIVDEKIVSTTYLECFIAQRMDYFADLIKPASREGQGVDKALLMKKIICIPPSEVLDVFLEKYNSIMHLTEIRNQENSRLSTLRDTLLPRLMSGELEVPE